MSDISNRVVVSEFIEDNLIPQRRGAVRERPIGGIDVGRSTDRDVEGRRIAGEHSTCGRIAGGYVRCDHEVCTC